MSKGQLVYADLDDEFFVLPRGLAEARVRESKALASATSWRQLLDIVPGLSEDWIREMLSRPEEDEEDLDEDEKFSLDDPVDLEGLAENGYPSPVGLDMRDWFDAEGLRSLFKRHAQVDWSALDEELPGFSSESGKAILKRLRKLGYECEEDEPLVRAALGM